MNSLIVVIIVTFLAQQAWAGSVPYCTWSGCAQPTYCKCATSFAECDITPSDPEGTCRFTSLGIALSIVGGVLVVALLSALVSALSCFRKMLCCCCRKKDTHVHYHNSNAQAMQEDL